MSRCSPAAAAVVLLLCSAQCWGGASLFDAMGGDSTLHAVVDRFAGVIVADDRINFTFADADMAKFRKLLFEQLCEISGGPCRYTGRTMREAHAKLKLTKAQFNALAEDLYIAMRGAGVSYHVQNRLMAKLAPMERDIVSPSGGSRPAAAAP